MHAAACPALVYVLLTSDDCNQSLQTTVQCCLAISMHARLLLHVRLHVRTHEHSA